jgi:hypothetical protein
MTTMSGGTVIGEGTTRLFGVLSKFQQNHAAKAAAVYVTFEGGDGYWIMFDGNGSTGASSTQLDANTSNPNADFELLDGGAFVRTEFAGTQPMAGPRRWPILVTQHVTINTDGTEFAVKNTDSNHNAVTIYLIKGGPVQIADLANSANSADLTTVGKFITATFNPGPGTVSFSAEQTTSPTDSFLNGIKANASNLCN